VSFPVCLLSCFNVPPTLSICSLSLHDALPISMRATAWAFLCATLLREVPSRLGIVPAPDIQPPARPLAPGGYVSETRRNFTQKRSEEHTSEPSHLVISYAVFCLKKKTTPDKLQ